MHNRAMEDDLNPSCLGCSTPLVVPYIRCLQCRQLPFTQLCLHCFAKGVEFSDHHSNHKYTVIRNDFPLFDNDWTAEEELKLLDVLGECGIGNWADVAQHMQSKSKSSCEVHYKKHYLENPSPPMPVMPMADRRRHPCPVPFRATDEPPRPTEGSALQTELSGYMPARGDFGVEYDNYAEADLRDITFMDEDEEIFRGLKLTAVDVYRNVLLERIRRKKIIKDCGLINVKKNVVFSRRLERTIGSSTLDTLRVFQRMVPPVDWDLFIESWHYEIQLRHSIKRLQEYRADGLKTLASCRIYDRLRARREEQRGRRHLMSDVIHHLEDKNSCQMWLKKQTSIPNKVSKEGTSQSNTARKPLIPLEIETLPGYEKLTDKEKEMCSQVRLVPESYMDFKNILMTECNKMGFLRLAQARTLIKIDVNKTRKIYDFLLEEGHIYREPIVK